MSNAASNASNVGSSRAAEFEGAEPKAKVPDQQSTTPLTTPPLLHGVFSDAGPAKVESKIPAQQSSDANVGEQSPDTNQVESIDSLHAQLANLRAEALEEQEASTKAAQIQQPTVKVEPEVKVQEVKKGEPSKALDQNLSMQLAEEYQRVVNLFNKQEF